jgi:hypothetical protein
MMALRLFNSYSKSRSWLYHPRILDLRGAFTAQTVFTSFANSDIISKADFNWSASKGSDAVSEVRLTSASLWSG